MSDEINPDIDNWYKQRRELHAASEMLLNAKEEYNAKLKDLREKMTKIELGITNEIEIQASQMTDKGHALSNAQKREIEKSRRLEENREYQNFKKEEEVTTMEYNARERKISLDVKQHRDNAEFFKMKVWMKIANKMSEGRID